MNRKKKYAAVGRIGNTMSNLTEPYQTGEYKTLEQTWIVCAFSVFQMPVECGEAYSEFLRCFYFSFC